MKITDIETFVIHPQRGKNMLFVKLTTDNGIVGWGESYTQTDRDTAAIAHIEQLGRYLEGRDPLGLLGRGAVNQRHQQQLPATFVLIGGRPLYPA